MTAKITLMWDNDSIDHVDQIVYKSMETFTVDNLPPILARVGLDSREYIDTDIVTGTIYYYAIASEKDDGDILLSSVITATAGLDAQYGYREVITGEQSPEGQIVYRATESGAYRILE